MDEQAQQPTQAHSALLYSAVGVGVILLVAAGVYFLRPKSAPVPTAETMPIQATPTPGTITGLACERQWYNPVVGFAKYYLGVEGVDLATTRTVTCDFSVSVGATVVATASAKSGLTPAVDRGGGTFRCDSPPLALEPNVPTVVDVLLKNDTDQTASCSRTFLLPQP